MQVGFDLHRQLQNLRDDSCGLARPDVGARYHHLGAKILRDEVSGAIGLLVSEFGERKFVRSGGENSFAIADTLAVPDQDQFAHSYFTSIPDSCASG